MDDPASFLLLFFAEPAGAVSENSLSIILLKIFSVIVLVFINGFFVAAEFAFVAVRKSRIETLASEAKEQFPLSETQCASLRAQLQSGLTKIVAAEETALADMLTIVA